MEAKKKENSINSGAAQECWFNYSLLLETKVFGCIIANFTYVLVLTNL